MKILITGSNGLIGNAISKYLSNAGHIVEGIDKYGGITIREYVEDPDNDDNYFDLIIHCAANCIIREIIDAPALAKENITSTFDILEYARKINCPNFIYFSSSRVTHDEYNPYIVSKLFGEDLVKAYSQCYGTDYLIIRPETVWSMTDRHERVITRWIKNALNNETIVVFGNSNKELPPIHIDDFIESFNIVFNKFVTKDILNETLSISGHILKISEILSMVMEITCSRSEILFEEPELTQPQTCKPADIVAGSFKQRLEDELQ